MIKLANKPKLKYFKILFGISIILVLVFLLNNYFSFKSKKYNSLKINSSVLKNGDLILRCGKSTESYLVHLADNTSQFTHIGIIAFENGNPYVIHAVPHKNKNLKKESFSDFLNPKNASSYAIYRSYYNTETLTKVVNEAQNFYFKKYTFDNEYDLKTDTKLYCTELILKAFNNAGIYLKLSAKEFDYVIGKRKIIFPSEFTKKAEFNRII
jgi:hypothetical protein